MIEPLWQIDELPNILDGSNESKSWAKGRSYAHIKGISIDTRTLSAGDIFIALSGENFDGHDHCQTALDKGASLLIVNEDKFDEIETLDNPKPIPILFVEDGFKALIKLAETRRKQSKAKIIGITGSVGKTSLKTAMINALVPFGKVHGSIGNLNNHIGLPLSLARMPIDTNYGVFELGMNHQGEIESLSNLLRPNIGIITNVAAVHTEFFECIYDIALAKSEIISGMKQKDTLICFRESPFYSVFYDLSQEAGIKLKSFGSHMEADYRLHSYKPEVKRVLGKIEGQAKAQMINYDLPLMGVDQVTNFCAIAACLNELGLDIQKGFNELKFLKIPKGRGNHALLPWIASSHDKLEKQQNSFIEIIDESYNASPISMRSALLNLSKLNGKAIKGQKSQRKIAIIGDMLELGKNGQNNHEKLANILNKLNLDEIWLVGELMKYCQDNLDIQQPSRHFEKAEALADIIHELVQVGDMILVKGSRGMKTDIIIHAMEKAYHRNTMKAYLPRKKKKNK